ncbi:fdxN element excision recombinase XisF [Egbenema bharatensis]|uniref:fdxN element excision recombinase XisF n=1 Tax=Egbenema bharatensis TaxID=3463334 RepID=UPI003A8A9418
MKLNRIIGYARVSTREQAIDSRALEQQIDRLKAAGATDILYDVDSGTKDNRPNFQKLKGMIERVEIDEVIVTRIDRPTRSLITLRDFIRHFEGSGVNFRILDQQIDLSTAQGKLMVNILGSLAEWEVDLLSERVRHGKEHSRKNLEAPQSYPWGYLPVDHKFKLDQTPFLCLLSDRPDNYQQLSAEEDISQLPSITVADLAKDCILIFFEQKGVTRALKAIFAKYGIAKTQAKRNSFDRIFHWTTRGFALWLTNPVLAGHTAYCKDDRANKKTTLKDPKDWRMAYNTHPDERLVTDEEQAEIKQIIASNMRMGSGAFGVTSPTTTQSETYRKYAYQSGLVYCAECGSRCTTKASTNAGELAYYGCRYAKMGCGNHRGIRKQKIEQGLIRNLVEQAQILTQQGTKIDQTEAQTPPKSLRLIELEQQLEAISQFPGFRIEVEQLKESLYRQIEEEKNPFAAGSFDDRTVEELICAGNNLAIWQHLSNDDKVQIYQKLIRKVFIRNGEVESVLFNLSNSTPN